MGIRTSSAFVNARSVPPKAVLAKGPVDNSACPSAPRLRFSEFVRAGFQTPLACYNAKSCWSCRRPAPFQAQMTG
eukprot:1073291-Lingulodinium_polyedra.AAC.1